MKPNLGPTRGTGSKANLFRRARWSGLALRLAAVAAMAGSAQISVAQAGMPGDPGSDYFGTVHAKFLGPDSSFQFRQMPTVSPAPPPLPVARTRELRLHSSRDLIHVLSSGSPEFSNLLLQTLPRDWAVASEGGSRRDTFVLAMLPLISESNSEIQADRDRLKKILALGADANPEQKAWLKALARRYGTPAEQGQELLQRVDIIPPSLALAQAALETGWGASRFAIQGNALYGQRTWRVSFGIRPERAESARPFAVRRFANLLDSVRAYAGNLNTSAAYTSFREQRAKFRQADQVPLGPALARNLIGYSTERDVYVKKLLNVIRASRLARFDRMPEPSTIRN